jgi:protein tyrosine phosphatase (PTP) superfamily phosphohydrolase (DUF442 family)
MIARQRLLAAALAGLLGLSGCCGHKQQCSYCPPVPGSAPRTAPIVVPGAPVPVNPGFQPAAAAQPAFVPANPPQPAPVPANPPPVPAQPGLQPSDTGSLSADPPNADVRLTAPQVPDSPRVAMAAPSPGTPTPPRETPTTPSLDIPGFALAKSKVATGQKPFADGMAWLQAQGYRTVLHVRTAGENDKAAQREFEKYNLRYLTLEVAPGALTRETVEAFNQVVNDSSNYPIFVFDRDGALAGGLWLLHFRLFEGVSEEKARLEAARLGFKPEQAEHKAMAEAVSRYLQNQNP